MNKDETPGRLLRIGHAVQVSISADTSSNHRSFRRQLSTVTVAAALVFIADWSSKYMASHSAIMVVHNPKQTPLSIIPFLCLLSGLLVWLVDQPVCNLGVGIFTGAWLANCSDRFFRGPVVDFISGGKIFPDAVFDLADICLAIGVVLMFIGLLLTWRKGQIGTRLPERSRKIGSASSNLWFVIAVSSGLICLQWVSGHLAPQLLGPEHVVYDHRHPILVLIIIVAIAVVYLCRRLPTRALAISLGMLIGGGIANLSMRLLQGSVPDFIRLPWPGSPHLETNLADMAIVCGAGLLIILTMLGHWKIEPDPPNPQS